MIYVTGDMHGGAEGGRHRLSSRQWPEGKALTRGDYVIVAGDFGYVWDGSRQDGYWLDWLEAKPWTTLFVDGNHENFDLLEAYPEESFCGGHVNVVRPHVLHLMRGHVFDLGGTSVFAMGGAESTDKKYRKEGRSWWPQELPCEEERERAWTSLDACGWEVDYVVTHEAPRHLAKELCVKCQRDFYDNTQQRFLEKIDRRLSYKAWFFGHYHDDEWRDDRHRLIYIDVVPIDVDDRDERKML